VASLVASLGARVAAQKRHHGASSAEYLAARQVHAAAAIEGAVEHYLAAAPPLTDEQVERIAERLRGAAGSEAGA